MNRLLARPLDVFRDPDAPHVAIVTLNNPERRNAFGLAMREGLLTVLEDLMFRRDDCRAIVLTGAGGAFCAGGDISEMRERTSAELRQRNRLPVRIFELLADGPKPVISAIEGAAMGAGLALAAASDEVVAASDARFCAAFARVGLLPDTGLYWSLAQRVGAGCARELMLTAREFDGAQALSMGVCDEIVAPGHALAAACLRARQYLALPPLAVAMTRACLARGADTLEQTIESELNLQPLMRRSQDHQEAVAAFVEKRSAQFVGN